MTTKVLCLGESVIDVVIREDSTTEHVGGSLLNVATGLARLDVPTTIGSWWARDERGDRLANWAATCGVSVLPGTDSAERTPVAFAQLDAAGKATYELDIPWDLPPMADLNDFGHLHTGSIAATVEPGGQAVVAAAQQLRDRATISYDPNVRPALMLTPAAVRDRIETIVGLADLVKASDEDLEWLYPDEPPQDVIRRWIGTGPAMVVLTRGPLGASVLLAGEPELRHLEPLEVDLADTVGAGDSFMAGLIQGLLEGGLLGGPAARERLRAAEWAEVRPALHNAVITSGITVSKHGAYPPTPAEVEAVKQTRPALR